MMILKMLLMQLAMAVLRELADLAVGFIEQRSKSAENTAKYQQAMNLLKARINGNPMASAAYKLGVVSLDELIESAVAKRPATNPPISGPPARRKDGKFTARAAPL